MSVVVSKRVPFQCATLHCLMQLPVGFVIIYYIVYTVRITKYISKIIILIEFRSQVLEH